jgi:hypothetical protein
MKASGVGCVPDMSTVLNGPDPYGKISACMNSDERLDE